MTIYDKPGIFKVCWTKSASSVNIIHGFNVSGVFPFNSNVFKDDEFASCTVTDRPDPNTNNSKSNESEEPNVSNVAYNHDGPTPIDDLS